MRFLILSQYFVPEIGAASVRLEAMIRELVRHGHEVEIVTSLPNYPQGRIFEGYRSRLYMSDKWEDLPVHRTWLYACTGGGMKRMVNYASFTATCLLGLMRSRKPDYIFVESPPLFLSIPGWLAGKVWRVPFIFNVADLWPDSVRELGVLKDGFIVRVAERLERWSYRKAAYINAVTKGIHNTLVDKKSVSPQKILFLPNGVDTHLFRPRTPEPGLAEELGLAGKKILLYAGTLGFAHGFEVAIEAMDCLNSVRSDIALVCIGSGSEKQRLVALAKEKNVQNVHFLEPAPVEYIARLYSISYAGLSTLKNSPLFEGTRPSKLFPIMASGKPVIYCGVGEGARLIEEAKAGFITPPENPQALANVIAELADSPERAETAGQNGRRYVEMNMSWSEIVSRWLQDLDEREGRLPMPRTEQKEKDKVVVHERGKSVEAPSVKR